MSLTGNAKPNEVLRGRISRLDVMTLSAYGIAVKNGFEGTEEEWLASLKGKAPIRGVDYWTEADKAEIIAEVSAQVLYPATVE